MSAAPDTSGAPALSVRELSLTFPNGTKALEGVDLDVHRGAFVSIVGPSGCGKSTLLRVAAGLTEPSSGTIEIDRSHLGFTFQEATLLPWRTVLGNVELFMELRGVDREERKAIAMEQIARVGLSGFETQLPRALSGGMRMRVSLARSLALRPSTFFFDEPFGALDEITREQLQEELLDLFARDRFAGLFITHSISEAVFLSTRVLVMSARPGKLTASFEIPFAYPRRRDLRYAPEFAELSGEISHALRMASGLEDEGGRR